MSDDTNYDNNCTSKAKLIKQDPPLLFDLSVDPGERYSLEVKSHKEIFNKMLKIRENMSKQIKWAESETNKGTKRSAFPCCNKVGSSCEPFPKCCDCKL